MHSYELPTSSTDLLFPWKKVWNLPVQQKVRIFVWKICRNILPTTVTLQQKKVYLPSSCVLCNGGNEESIEHIGRDCSFVQTVIRNAPSLLGKLDNFENHSIHNWWKDCFTSLTSAESGLLAVLVWSCWKERNRRVWNGDFMEPTRVGLLASTSYSFYLQVQPVKLPKRLRLKQVWQRPRSEWIKVNCDRAMDWNTKEGAASYVCRDESGLVVSGGCHYLTVAASPALMEAEALRMACMHAKAREWQKVEFEVDCLGLVNVINSEEDDDAVIGQVIEDIKVLLHSFDNFLIIHVYREANCAAHRLARFSLCSRVSASWVGILPNHIQGHALEFCI